jgi:Rrf2 family protein
MLKFNSQIRYGLRAVLHLAKKNQLASIKEISKAENIPANYLEKIMLDLKKSGIVKATRGQAGGYSLAKKPQDLDLTTIFSALDKNLTKSPCAKFCQKKHTCQAKNVWQIIDQNFKQSLKNINLYQLIHPVK